MPFEHLVPLAGPHSPFVSRGSVVNVAVVDGESDVDGVPVALLETDGVTEGVTVAEGEPERVRDAVTDGVRVVESEALAVRVCDCE